MASIALIPVSEYLSSSYEPDCDYVNGELEERSVGELSHGVLQALLVALFNGHRKEWGIFAGTEVRVQINSDRYRVPDVCVLRRSDPFDAVVQKAPLICIELLSPEDRVRRLQQRLDDYLGMGVENVWVIDPISRHAWTVTADGSQHVLDALMVADSPIRISLADVFAELDEIQSGR